MSQIGIKDEVALAPTDNGALPMLDKPKLQKNSRAVAQTASWLQAVGVSTRPSTSPYSDLVVETAAGAEIEIKLSMVETEPVPAMEHLLVIAANQITSKSRDTALQAFHVITEAAGFGTPTPVDRGPNPEHKLHYSDNFELVSMRHTEFRRAPNPKTADLLQYKTLMTRACYRFINMNSAACRRHCLLLEDLMTYAMVWTTNFLGLYKVQNPTDSDNEKLLYRHLKQRFAEFAQMMVKKERNTIPSPDTVNIALLGRPVDENHRLEGFSTDPFNAEEAEPEAPEVTEAEEKARRLVAASTLAKSLAALPHERMLEILAEAATNRFLNIDAQGEAARQLRLHRRDCDQCKAQAVAPAAVVVEVTIETLRVQFWDGVAPAWPCSRCNVTKTKDRFGMRLTNGPMVVAKKAKPKFSTQPQCKTCRNKKSVIQVQEHLPGNDPGSLPKAI